MFEQPDLRPCNTKNQYVLFQDWDYTWTEKRGNDAPVNCKITIRKGTTSDLASVPKPFWCLGHFQPDGLHRGASLLHDELYKWEGHIGIDLPDIQYYEQDAQSEWIQKARDFPRPECDLMFLHGMQDAHDGVFTAHAMFDAVRVFGWIAW